MTDDPFLTRSRAYGCRIHGGWRLPDAGHADRVGEAATVFPIYRSSTIDRVLEKLPASRR